MTDETGMWQNKNTVNGCHDERRSGMRKKEQLIPAGKSKKIIQLDRRGLVKRRPIGAVIWGVVGLLCLLYCLVIGLFLGFGTFFFLIWGAIAAVCGLLSFLSASGERMARIPRWVKKTVLVLWIVGLAAFAVVEAMILREFDAYPAEGADYCIILGAQWKADGPSYILQKRLDAALAYLRENPDTIVIVSGGRGSNEPISEAEGMEGYLVSAGIPKERILTEDARVVLVTNDFHVFRACGIARKQGYAHLEGLAAGSFLPMLPNNLLREFLGVIKDAAVGNM